MPYVYKRSIICLLLVLICIHIPVLPALASQATSYTYTLDEDGYWTRTQDAYLPDKTITNLGLAAPDDLYIDQNNMMYIADSQNRRIVKYSIDTGLVVGVLTNENLRSPRGVFVTDNGDIYVADPSAKMVFWFDKDFNLLQSIGRPKAPSYADTPYEPLRVAIDNGGNIYIVGEGVYNGVIQLSSSGDFLGYFTVNKTRLSFIQAIQNAIFTRAQLENLVARVPTTFSNVFIDRKGIVYSTTMGRNSDSIKKHNTAGGNMLIDQPYQSSSMTDVYVDDKGIIYTSIHDGYIEIFSSTGELIFEFGSYVFDIDVSGLYSRLPTIAVDNNGNIWTADGDKGYLQSFKPTDYALMVYKAMGLYEKGLYDEALEQWSEVLKLNQMSVLAHNGVGKAYLRAGLYEEAMVHFEVAGNREYFSEAYWEVRNTWIQANLSWIAALIVLLMLISFLINKLDKNRVIYKKRRSIKRKLYKVPVLKDVLFAFKIPKHPIDQYYNLRVNRSGSALGATIIYILLFILYMAYQTSKGFIYQFSDIEDMDINAIVIGFLSILALVIICNYLVTSIKDGDGSLKQVYMIPAYGMLPAMVSMLTVIIMSHFLTQNEAFILTIVMIIGVVWSIINIFLGFQTVHDYTSGETVVSLIITAMFIVIVTIISLIIIIMWERLWEFLKTIGMEAMYNVFR
ncbi:MAG: tetratricopeptide repeat protein [Anaerolineaceae bacterium]|nr:MAG: tetratricopeptide repeat protein [Anaerolineaceae bacterium]